jgi:predicted DNA binding CopG/RHH family protein
MAASAPNQPSHTRSSFASLLEQFAARNRNDVKDTSWNDGDLEADVASLSYDRALRMHARTPPETAQSAHSADKLMDTSATVSKMTVKESSLSHAETRKSASVTIRLSQNELKLLHARAIESGLNISAYLRSCVFEVEDLRSQVKSTLLELRTVNQKCDPQAQPRWFRTLFAQRHAVRHSAQA